MRNIPRDTVTFLLTQATVTKLVGKRIFHGSVPQTQADPYIWISRSGSEQLECLGDSAGQEPFRQYLDVECISDDIGKAQEIADAVESLFPFTGTYGSASVQGAFCNSQDDSYVSRNTARAEFTHFAALSLEVIP